MVAVILAYLYGKSQAETCWCDDDEMSDEEFWFIVRFSAWGTAFLVLLGAIGWVVRSVWHFLQAMT